MKQPRPYHQLKIDRKYWCALECGDKRAEFRKADRDFQKGDELELRCVDIDYQTLRFVITHVVYGPEYGIPEGYCMLSINQPQEGEENEC